MRKTWIVLVLFGVIPAGLFYVLKWTGATESLRYISTTCWQAGDPSVFQILCMFLSVFSWAWVKGFINLFLFAAIPFAAADLSLSLRRRKLGNLP